MTTYSRSTCSVKCIWGTGSASTAIRRSKESRNKNKRKSVTPYIHPCCLLQLSHLFFSCILYHIETMSSDNECSLFRDFFVEFSVCTFHNQSSQHTHFTQFYLHHTSLIITVAVKVRIVCIGLI